MLRNEHLYLCELLYLIHLCSIYIFHLIHDNTIVYCVLSYYLDIASDIATLILLLANFDNYLMCVILSQHLNKMLN